MVIGGYELLWLLKTVSLKNKKKCLPCGLDDKLVGLYFFSDIDNLFMSLIHCNSYLDVPSTDVGNMYINLDLDLYSLCSGVHCYFCLFFQNKSTLPGQTC